MSRTTVSLKGMFVGRKTESFERFAEEVRPLVEITDWHQDPARSHGAIKKSSSALVFVDLADDPLPRLHLANRIVTASPGTLVFTLAASKSPDIILEAFRQGVTDFLLWPGPQGEALAAVRRALDKLETAPRRGEIFAVFSVKGGQGVSTVALNLADHLCQLSGEKVLLFDLNLYMGEIGVRLDLEEHYTPFDLQKDLKRLDRELLFSSLRQHDRGFYLLAAPGEISDADRLKVEDITMMLEALTAHLDFLVLDLPHDFSAKTLAALDAADQILLLAQQDLAAVKITQRVLQFFRECGYGREKIRLLLNRYLRRGDLNAGDLEKILQQPVFAVLENDYAAVLKSINTGKTVDLAEDKSMFNQEVKDLAGKLLGLPPLAAVKPLWQRAWARCLQGLNSRK